MHLHIAVVKILWKKVLSPCHTDVMLKLFSTMTLSAFACCNCPGIWNWMREADCWPVPDSGTKTIYRPKEKDRDKTRSGIIAPAGQSSPLLNRFFIYSLELVFHGKCCLFSLSLLQMLLCFICFSKSTVSDYWKGLFVRWRPEKAGNCSSYRFH